MGWGASGTAREENRYSVRNTPLTFALSSPLAHARKFGHTRHTGMVNETVAPHCRTHCVHAGRRTHHVPRPAFWSDTFQRREDQERHVTCRGERHSRPAHYGTMVPRRPPGRIACDVVDASDVGA